MKSRIMIFLICLPLLLTMGVSADTPLQDWHSLSDLKTFLAFDDTNEWVYLKADNSGNVNLNGRCEVFAFQLRSRAEVQGYRLETEILSYSDVMRYLDYLPQNASSLAQNNSHMINKAIIGNEIWFVEPQNDKVWLAYYLEPPTVTPTAVSPITPIIRSDNEE